MRRPMASLLTSVALLCAGAAWMAFAAGFTVLDPGRSARIADTLIEQPAVRDAAADALAGALRSWWPPGTPVPEAEVEAIARRALDDPRALTALRDAVVGAHQGLLGQTDGPVRLDGSALLAAGRDALLSANPELAGRLPATGDLGVDLPTDDLPDLSGTADLAATTRVIGGLLAVAFLGFAFLVAPQRFRVLSRAGRWAIGAGFTWAALGWVAPYALSRLDDPRLSALGSMAVAVAGPMITPSVLLVGSGIGALVSARAWRLAASGAGRAGPPSNPPAGPSDRPGGPGPSAVRRRAREPVAAGSIHSGASASGTGGPYDLAPPPSSRRTWRL